MRYGVSVVLVTMVLPIISCGDLLGSDEIEPAAAPGEEESNDALRRRPRPGGGGGTGTGTAGTTGTTGTGGSVGMGTGGTGTGTPSGPQAIAPCASESDFVRSGVVTLRAGGQGFFPACVRLASGGTVVFQALFQEHPLRRRDLGTTPSPITGTNFGGVVEYEFPDQGLFAYGCAAHPNEIGVVWSSTQ